jgi:hypothetical protein
MLTIDDDVFEVARERAEREDKTVDEVLSAVLRTSLIPSQMVFETKNGIPQLPIRPGSKPVTLEIVNQLRDELV